jgi:glutamate-ammonia-ligase adenylyltransferase
LSPLRKHKKFSDGFIRELTEVSAGYLSPEAFEKFIKILEQEITSRYFSHTVESNILRIIHGMYDKISFFNDCINYPHYTGILTSVASNSNYMTDILVRNPEYFYWVVNPSNLELTPDRESITNQVKNAASVFKSFEAKLKALRGIKRKETLRTGTKDIFLNVPLEEITGELSSVAKAVSAELFDLCYKETLNKYGIAFPERKYALFALGKLGGNELNYSSDIDLMIFYDDDETASGSVIKTKKTYQEILIETIYLFIESATKITGAGYIYRVDFRLRPDGRNSMLTRTMSYYLNYYESRGEDWEKQMLIKASFVGGDENLYNSFMNYLSPFIYPSSFLISPTEQIKRLKQSIEKRLGDEENIKLSAGGIRDIEFSVQALQLLYGGKIKKLRTPNTLEAINRLREENLLSVQEADDLITAYIFFRKTEHFLQLMNDKQTHTIPSGGEILENLSFYMGYKNTAEFKSALKKLMDKVSQIYFSIMGEPAGVQAKKEAAIPFENKIKAEKDIVYLREGKGIMGQRQFDKDTIDSFLRIEDSLMLYLKKSLNPDLVLQNFARVIRAENFPSIWYKEFLNEKFFHSFLTICEFSQKAVDIFAEDEKLRELFLNRKVFEKLTSKNLAQYSAKRIIFSILVQFTLGLINSQQVSEALTNYFILKTGELTPADEIKKGIKTNFFIAGLGSFGSGDISFASDIDLIFAADEIQGTTDVQKYFQSLFLKLKEEFKPFEIDCRLRPEGKSSWLVWDLKNYEQYLYNRARVWELQALCKIRFITGDKKLYSRFLNIIKKRIEREEKTGIVKQIFEMRKKLYPPNYSAIAKNINIKKSRGGNTDIEFIVQSLILKNPDIYKSAAGKSTARILLLLAEKKGYSDLQPLISNFSFLKNLELLNQGIFNVLTTVLPPDEKKLKILALRSGFSSAAELQSALQKVMRVNQSLFDKYMGV